MTSISAKKIIKDRGGIGAVSRALSTPDRKVPKSTVQHWYETDRLPWWRVEAVMALPVVEDQSHQGAAA